MALDCVIDPASCNKNTIATQWVHARVHEGVSNEALYLHQMYSESNLTSCLHGNWSIKAPRFTACMLEAAIMLLAIDHTLTGSHITFQTHLMQNVWVGGEESLPNTRKWNSRNIAIYRYNNSDICFLPSSSRIVYSILYSLRETSREFLWEYFRPL